MRLQMVIGYHFFVVCMLMNTLGFMEYSNEIPTTLGVSALGWLALGAVSFAIFVGFYLVDGSSSHDVDRMLWWVTGYLEPIRFTDVRARTRAYLSAVASSEIRCEYCACLLDADRELCDHCGAPNPRLTAATCEYCGRPSFKGRGNCLYCRAPIRSVLSTPLAHEYSRNAWDAQPAP